MTGGRSLTVLRSATSCLLPARKTGRGELQNGLDRARRAPATGEGNSTAPGVGACLSSMRHPPLHGGALPLGEQPPAASSEQDSCDGEEREEAASGDQHVQHPRLHRLFGLGA